jgi:Na+-driven multidrug efflux pump
VISRVIAMAASLGVLLTAVLALSSDQLPRLFTADPEVLQLMGAALPFVVATQGINALAFAWDGVLFGAKGFR